MTPKGDRKPKLRDYSSLTLTMEQSAELRELLLKLEQHSITIAILGAVMVEHELDALLRRRFKRNDNNVWDELVSDRGPLNSLYAKIAIGYAFQLLEPFAPLRSHNAKLGQMRPQGIDHLGPLPHQKIARSMQHQLALLLGRFNLHKTHGRPPHRLADRLRVGGIVLVALDVGLHVFGRHQPHLVTKLRQFTRPIMGRSARLHADKARPQRLKERQHLAAPQLLPNDDLFGRVDAVNLEHVLGDIQTDRGNLHVDGSPHVICLRRTTLWHLDAESGRRPPHQLRTRAPQQTAPSHSITLSALTNSVCGTVRPSAVAVLRLISNWYVVGR